MERIQLLRKEEETQKFWCGLVKIRLLPEGCTEEEYHLWWPRLTEQEKERYTVHEAHNVLTTSGFTQLLNYIAGNSTTAISQYFAVGNTPIVSVQAADTVVNGEFFRKAPTSNSIVGNQLTLSTLFGSSDGNGTYTNAGLWGNGASGTLGSGTLYTHTLYSYSKSGGTSISNDYVITLS